MVKPIKEILSAIEWAKEETLPVLGEGISRTSERGARLWSVDVMFPGNRVMRTTILAKNNSQALKFSKNRYPNATHFKFNGRATR